MRADGATEQGRLPWWLADALWIAAIAAVFIFIVTAAWGRALDPITDTGRDLYIPEQIRDGAKLYRDILYYYPPLTPYLLALVTAVIGSTLEAYALIGAATAALTAAALYTAGRIAGGPHAGGSAALLFVSGSVFSMTGRTTNYLIPYAYAATVGMLFLLAATVCLLWFLFVRPSRIWLSLALLSLLAASWTKIEYVAYSGALLLVVTLFYGVPARWLAVYAALGAATLGFVHVYFSDAPASQHWLWQNVLAPSLLSGEAARYFYRQVSGLDAAARNAGSAAAGAIIIIAMAAAIRWADGIRRSHLTAIVALAFAAVTFVAGGVLTRGWAFLQIALIPFAWRRRDPLLLLIVLSVCASSRVFLRLFPAWYGFVYAIPTYLLIGYVLFEWLPKRGFYARRMALLWVVPVAMLAAQFVWVERTLLERKTHAVQTDRGIFHEANPHRAAVLNEFLTYARERRPQSLVVIPEGLALNYLARVPNPLSFHTFTPVETASAEIEARIIEQMRAREPELIAIVTRSVTDFGFRGFGIDYNRDLAALIRRRYRVQRHWRLPGFELILLERSDSRS